MCCRCCLCETSLPPYRGAVCVSSIQPDLIIIPVHVTLFILKNFDTVMATYERIDIRQRESLKKLEEKVM